MKTIEQGALIYVRQNGGCTISPMYDGFEAGALFVQTWIPVEEELPACFESGEWDGARSEFVLVKHSDSSWRKGRLYSGILDGHEYNDWYDENDYELENITHWRPIEIL